MKNKDLLHLKSMISRCRDPSTRRGAVFGSKYDLLEDLIDALGKIVDDLEERISKLEKEKFAT